MGRAAAELIFRRLDGDTWEPTTHVVPTVLVPRGSGEIPGPHRPAKPGVPGRGRGHRRDWFGAAGTAYPSGLFGLDVLNGSGIAQNVNVSG